MKRGASSSSKSTGSGRRNAQASPVLSDSSPGSLLLSSSSPRASSNAAASPSTATSTAGSPRAEGTNYLVALAGMRALQKHVQDLSKGKKWKDRVASWEERAGLGLPSVKLALGFLDVLGVSRASVYKQLLESALRALLDKIPHLNEERMLLLLNDSFRYATQPELKSVPLKIITSMSVVPDKVLEKIIELQTHEPAQFEELGLPLAIKRLAWEKDAALFVRVASPHAEKYMSSEYAPKMIIASQQVRSYKSLDTMKRRKLMGPQMVNALAECTGGRPILINYLCDEIADRFAHETSLSKAGLWATLLTDVLVTARERAYGSIADPAVDRLCALASRLDLAVREDSFGDSAVRDVQRLFREATGIGEDQQEMAKGDRRGSSLDKAKQEDESTRLRKTLKSAWASVSKLDKNGWFTEPVTEKIAQGYHKVIKTPMDLSTVLRKIKGGGYPSYGDFDRDLRLMWENCRVYNGKGTEFFDVATKIENDWSKISPSFEDALRRQEAQAAAALSAANNSNNNNKRKGSASSQAQQDDSRGNGSGGGGGGGGGGAPLTSMAPATQLEREGLGRRVGLAAMLLSEPFAAKLMYRHASDRVPAACRERETLPRDHPTFAPLLQLLELGNAARAMFRAGSFGVRAVEEHLTRSVLPCVVVLHMRAEEAVVVRRSEGGGGGGGVGGEGDNGAARRAGDEEDAAASGVKDNWRKWYKEFPAVRRVTCTMLCRALVQKGDEAAELLMPSARAAVRRMGDEKWLWNTLADVLQKNAMAKKGDENAARVLKPEILKAILELFSRALESAAVSDAVFSKSLELVANLLPVASPSSSTATAAGGRSGSGNKGVPRSALEEMVDKAAARAANQQTGTRKIVAFSGAVAARGGLQEQHVKGLFGRVFAKAPEWQRKLTPPPAPPAPPAEKARARNNGEGRGASVGDKQGERPPRPVGRISIKGPAKRRLSEEGAGGRDGSRGAKSARKKARG